MTGAQATLERAFTVLRPELAALFRAQWSDPELPAMEYRSAERLCAFLEQHGFVVERTLGGLPTAFLGKRLIGKGGPVIAFLCEYDALPGLASTADAEMKPLPLAAGHACGHNHIGPANATAAILTAAILQDSKIPAEIRVYGCPAEELLWGKIALWRAGVFAGVDVILTSHGDYQTGALSRPCQSVVSGEFVFLGRAGHGGFATAANALEGAEAFVAAAEDMQRTTFAHLKFRHILRRPGLMPSITPDEARVWYTVRGSIMEDAQAAYAALVSLAGNADAAKKLQHRHQFIAESRGYLPNDVLGGLLFRHMKANGPPAWSNSDLTFMSELSERCAPGEAMRLHRDVDYFTESEDYYGQDDGELSWRIPLGRVNWAYPEQVTIHHRAWTALSGHEASSPGPLLAAKTLALAAADLATNPEIVASAQSELARRTAGFTLPQPRIGALKTLTENPASFWDGSWVE